MDCGIKVGSRAAAPVFGAQPIYQNALSRELSITVILISNEISSMDILVESLVSFYFYWGETRDKEFLRFDC